MSTNRSEQPILVTGASRGIGLACALRLAEIGHRVWAGVRTPESAESVRASAAKRKVHLETVQIDVTDEESTRAAIDEVAQSAGGLYGLVNNAGVTGRSPFEEFPVDYIERIFSVNVFGSMRVTRHVLPIMRKARAGRIIFITSIGGRIGSMSVAPYCASKFALEGFGESLYLEMKPFNVDVVLVAPGMIKTDIWSEDNRILGPARNEKGPYYELFWEAERLATSVLNSSKLTVEDVAATVERVIEERSPKLRYVVGRRASIILSLRRHLPGQLFEKLYFGAILNRVTRTFRSQPSQ